MISAVRRVAKLAHLWGSRRCQALFWEHESHGCHDGAGFSLQRAFVFGVAFCFCRPRLAFE